MDGHFFIMFVWCDFVLFVVLVVLFGRFCVPDFIFLALPQGLLGIVIFLERLKQIQQVLCFICWLFLVNSCTFLSNPLFCKYINARLQTTK